MFVLACLCLPASILSGVHEISATRVNMILWHSYSLRSIKGAIETILVKAYR